MKFRKSFFLNIKTYYQHMSSNSFSNAFSQRTDLNRAVREAEKIVGYPTSFLNLRWLLNDDIANIALHLRKLIEINHPLLQTARKLFLGSTTPAWGLIVLLISKAAGLNSTFSGNEKDVMAGILHSQRVLAEVVEMIRTSNLLHKSLLNMKEKEQQEVKDLIFGNKLALLSGDYLLSSSFRELARIKNHKLNELMSSALRDLVEADFIKPHDKQSIPFPNKPVNLERNLVISDIFDTRPYNIQQFLGNPRVEWTIRNILGGASLLGKSCQGALMLAKHSQETQELGYLFGKYVALAWQAQVEQEAFTTDTSESFSLISAPIMMQLECDPTLYEKIVSERCDDDAEIDYKYLREVVCNGDGLKMAKHLQKELSSNALDILNKFPRSEARVGLANIVNTML